MKKVEQDIQNIDNKIKLLYMKERESEERIKKCSYFNKGFGKLGSECPFFHPENLCAQFGDEGKCL